MAFWLKHCMTARAKSVNHMVPPSGRDAGGLGDTCLDGQRCTLNFPIATGDGQRSIHLGRVYILWSDLDVLQVPTANAHCMCTVMRPSNARAAVAAGLETDVLERAGTYATGKEIPDAFA